MTETAGSGSPSGPRDRPGIVVLAAGVGSRYARGRKGAKLKQLEAVGPSGETILDYSVYDAHRAGFERAVFVIRPEIEESFREAVGDRIQQHVEVEYVHQTLTSGLAGADCPVPGRVKPWGTAHAALVGAERFERAPFALVNADDFYGARAFAMLSTELLVDGPPADVHHLVGYPLRTTLSEEGPVSRGICRTDSQGWLEELIVTAAVEPNGADAIYRAEDGSRRFVSGSAPASMNCWGFAPGIRPILVEAFGNFLRAAAEQGDTNAARTAELGLPSVVLEAVEAGTARVRVHSTSDRWLGITHPGDLLPARRELERLIGEGVYPETLWP